MLCIRNRPRQTGPIFLTISFLLLVAFIVHCHILYMSYQKRHRIAEYKIQMNEMFDTMRTMERIANSTATLLRKLQEVVNTHNHKVPKKKNFVDKQR